ncbi:MAG: dihydrodipicolinate synthase family protein [Burkholderiales bacterium]
MAQENAGVGGAGVGGLYAYAITPTRDGGDPDERKLAELIDGMIDAGVDGITVLGSTGALGSFSEAERMRVAEAAIGHAARRVRVNVGTGAITTAEAVRLARHAERAGADSVLVVPITYWILTEQELFEHYRAIAGAVSIPVGIYNNPRLTVTDLQPPLIARLAQIENVRFLKETSVDLMRIGLTRRLTAGRLHLAWGRDGAVLDALRLGADSWHCATSNVMPARCVELYRLAKQDPDAAQARRMYEEMRPFIEFCVQKGLVRAMHTALELLGRPMGPPRRPIGMLEGEDRAELSRLLKTVGLQPT